MTNLKKIGVLKLDTRFPRLAGDIGNPQSFRHDVIYETVINATPATIITGAVLQESLQRDFITAAQSLMHREVDIITTSCGFLSAMQNRLAASCAVPVITSSLTLLNLLGQCYGGYQAIGVLTFDVDSLNTLHLGSDTPGAVEGLATTDTLRQTIAADHTTLDQQQAQIEVLAACDRLIQQGDQLKAIILECTNLSPYKNAIRTHTGLAVFDIIDAVNWLLASQPSPHLPS